jgi:SAM-dependent methyltransferase
MAQRVGPSGSVAEVDIDPAVSAYGIERLRDAEEGDFRFHADDLLTGETPPGAPFDLVFCRFLLIHMDDPVAMVRHLAALTKPGSVVVAMDYETMRHAPFHPTLSCGTEILNGTLAAVGRPLDAGVRLGEWFVAAGPADAARHRCAGPPRGCQRRSDAGAGGSGLRAAGRPLRAGDRRRDRATARRHPGRGRARCALFPLPDGHRCLGPCRRRRPCPDAGAGLNHSGNAPSPIIRQENAP